MTELIKVAEWSGRQRGSVIFVHGLGGNAFDTWQRGNVADTFWPLWLAQDLKGIAVYSAQYRSSASEWFGASMPHYDQARSLLAYIMSEPALRSGPICFVCHSQGGLIVKHMLCIANESREVDPGYGEFVDRVTHVAFLATPHTGSGKANLLDWLRAVTRRSEAVRGLLSNDPSLRRLNTAYRSLAESRGTKVAHVNFYETDDTAGGRIVREGSADPGLPRCRLVPVAADHIEICKPQTRDALVYKVMLDFLSGFGKPLRSAGKLQPSAVPTAAPRPRAPAWAPAVVALVLLAVAAAGAYHYLTREELPVHAEWVAELGLPTEIGEQLVADITVAIDGRRMTHEAVRTFLAESAASRLDAEGYLPAFKRFGDEYEKLGKEVRALDLPEPLRQRKEKIIALISEGNLVQAKEELAALQSRSGEDGGDVDADQRAGILSVQARAAIVLQKFEEAARLFARAAETAESTGLDAWQYRLGEADAYFAKGIGLGDNNAVAKSVELFDALRSSRSLSDQQRLITVHNLGSARALLGSRNCDTAALREADQDLQSTLAALSRAEDEDLLSDTPVGVMTTRGTALMTLGQCSGDSGPVHDALDVFQDALADVSESETPLEWAHVNNSYAGALHMLGEMENDPDRLGQSAGIYRSVLDRLIQTGTWPIRWQIPHNLGAVLKALGRVTGSSDALRDSVEGYGKAMAQSTQGSPYWARSSGSQGVVRLYQSALRGDADLLAQAVDQISRARDVMLRAGFQAWSAHYGCQLELARTIGERIEATGALSAADVAAFPNCVTTSDTKATL